MNPKTALKLIHDRLCAGNTDQYAMFIGGLIVMERHPEYGLALLQEVRRAQDAERWEKLRGALDEAVRLTPLEVTA